jgi:copper(I)-binding protein
MRSFAFIVCLFLSACGTDTRPPLVATDIVVTAPMPGSRMSAGYMSFSNNTDMPIRISRVTSPDFGEVEIHESSLEDGVAKMRRIEVLTIPANSGVSLQRGGKHLMLMLPGDVLDTVSLSFYSADTLLLSVNTPVTKAGN